MNEGIGHIMDALRACRLAENTLDFFTSDNGGERYSDNWPFVGQKMDLMEGGIRVPLIAHWPARIAPARTDTAVITMDWAATMLAAAGVPEHADYPSEGLDLAPLFCDPQWDPPRGLRWRMLHRQQRALRSSRWKYLRVDGHDHLFDLSRDERERANLAALEPQRLHALRARWEALAATMPGIPPDARVRPVFGEADMPRPTH
jgi:arylsulfatase A-like enzyme